MNYPKIDIFRVHTHNGKRYFVYACSTTWSKTCKEAIARYRVGRELELPGAKDIKARFAK